MSQAERVFEDSTLSLVVPHVTINLPTKLLPSTEAKEWLLKLEESNQRVEAFFDERLDFLLALRVQQSVVNESPAEPTSPPALLLAVLKHLQVFCEATYISPSPANNADNRFSGSSNAGAAGFATIKMRSLNISPSVMPPQTPRPMPSTADADQQFVYSEGTPLQSYIWGENVKDEPEDVTFALLWSETEKSWVVLYKLSVVVSFIRTDIHSPLLCLTASVTLRTQPLASTPQRRELMALISAAEPLPPLSSSSPFVAGGQSPEEDDPTNLRGFDEVNLLDGLSTAFASKSEANGLYLPSTRLGPTVRRESYSLAPLSPSTPRQPKAIIYKALPTLTRSFRKTLKVVSGFRVRMRTVFVPFMFFSDSIGKEEDLPEAGAEERTVVLCVEIENPGDSGAGFAVENVQVAVNGEGARIRLIGWGSEGFNDAEKVFPLLIRSTEQYNLLYEVALLRPAEGSDGHLPSRSRISADSNRLGSDFQRPVSINIIGRPFQTNENVAKESEESENPSYMTSSFSSRWNCVLDLTSSRQRHSMEVSTNGPPARSILPAPPSPFPPFSPSLEPAEGKHFSFLKAAFNRSSFLSVNTSLVGTPDSLRSFTPNPPSTTLSQKRSSTPAMLSPPLPKLPLSALTPNTHQNFIPPPTPAYPAYNHPPPTPLPGQSPVAGLTGSVGPSVEIPREKMSHAEYLQSAGPRLSAPIYTDIDYDEHPERLSQPIVVSVALSRAEGPSGPGDRGSKKIFPLQEFSIDIFVFNQSLRTRRFEISYPDKKRRREEVATVTGNPGYLPLENKIRVGPLRPSTSQSVRMQFLAISPGIHSIESLILTDVESGRSSHLRSVLDVVVHEIASTAETESVASDQ